MVFIEPFEVEQWMDTYEVKEGVLNISETCAASLSIDSLQLLCKGTTTAKPLDTSITLGYGAIRGSKALRGQLAAQYPSPAPLPTENVLVTNGAIAANFLVLYALLGASDHVICVYPTYQQLYSVPESLGAEVSLWKLKEECDYQLDMTELHSLVKHNTKLIIINNPNNPTGAVLSNSKIQELVEFASRRGIYILSDEVYRPLFHGISPTDAEYPISLVSSDYDKTIVTGSMSKAYSLAGIRIGWIASRDPSVIEKCAEVRHYNTISVSQLDDQVATYALSDHVLHALLERNTQLARTNLAIMEAFVNKHSSVCSWVKPSAGTTTLLKFSRSGTPVDDVELCLDVLEKVNVLLVPACKTFGQGRDFKGTVRIGYVCETPILSQALGLLSTYLETHFGK